MAKAKIKTKDTMVAADMAPNRRVEEYLSDRDLAGFYDREIAVADQKDQKTITALKHKRRAARVAAVLAEED